MKISTNYTPLKTVEEKKRFYSDKPTFLTLQLKNLSGNARF